MVAKNGATLIFLIAESKITDFNNFWYTESSKNDTSDDCKFIHLTSKM